MSLTTLLVPGDGLAEARRNGGGAVARGTLSARAEAGALGVEGLRRPSSRWDGMAGLEVRYVTSTSLPGRGFRTDQRDG